MLMEGNVFAYLIRLTSTLLLISAVEAIVQVIDDVPSWFESALELSLEHFFIGLY